MPEIAQELHRRRHERVVFGELELGWEDASFVWRAFGALNKCFPDEQVILADGAGGDAVGWVGGEVLILLEEPLGGDGVHCDVVYVDLV